MPSVYIAGPMRGHPQLNWPAFDKAAALGRSLGWLVVSPAEMDRDNGVSDDAVPEFKQHNGGDPRIIRSLVQLDAGIIIGQLRAENGDAVALLPGWETSVGAVGEVALALWLKLQLLDARTFGPMEVQLKGLSFYPPAPGCEDGSCGVTYFQHVKSVAERLANHEALPMCGEHGGPRPCITLNGTIIYE